MRAKTIVTEETGRAAAGGERQRRVVAGVRLPALHALTANERGWIAMLRAIAGDADPPVTLRAVQALRVALAEG